MRLLTIGMLAIGMAVGACERTGAAANASASAATTAATSAPAADVPHATPSAAVAAAAPTAAVATPNVAAPAVREVTLPAGTRLPVVLDTGVGSDTSRAEQPVQAHIARPIVVHGQTVLAAGTRVSGVVTDARRSGKVKGLAHVGVRFDTLVPRGDDERYRIHTAAVGRTAQSTKKKDALEIGAPAAGGAIIGAIIGGKKGAGIGAAAGGGAGTAVVLSTRGKEVHLPKGSALTLRLSEPVTIRIRG
jgi:glucose/arabinose dehydrogenase